MPSRSTPPCLRKNVRPYTAGVKRTRQETRPERSPFFSDIQMASADVTVTAVTGNLTS